MIWWPEVNNMKLPFTLSFYISRNFFFYLALVFGIFFVLIFFIDIVEMLRKTAGKNISFIVVAKLVILKMPLLLQQVMPFVILVASSLSYSALARKSELVVIRSAGVSGLEFLLPSAVTAFFIGVLVLVFLNPASAIMVTKLKQIENNSDKNKGIELSENGVWIRQKELFEDSDIIKITEEELAQKNDFVINAKNLKKYQDNGKEIIYLTEIMVLVFNPESEFLYRIDAEIAYLEGSNFRIMEPKITYDNAITDTKEEIYLYTNLIKQDIEEGFPEPEEISFWNLKKYILKISSSGFSTTKYFMSWHKNLSTPLLYFVMTIIGSVFSLKSARHSNLGLSIVVTIIIGFIIYFTSNLINSLGLSGSLPIAVSIWFPILIIGLTGMFFLLKFEEG